MSYQESSISAHDLISKNIENTINTGFDLMLERLNIRRAELIKKTRVKYDEQHDLLETSKGVFDTSKVGIIEAIQKDCEMALYSADDLNSISGTLTKIDDLIVNSALLVTKKSKEIKTKSEDEDKTCDIYNLAPSIDNNRLRDLFSPFGPIEKCFIAYNGFGIYVGSVNFTNSASAKRAAISLDNSLLESQIISIIVRR